MTKNLNDVMGELSDLNIKIKRLLYNVSFEEYEEPDINYDRTDAEQLFIVDELKRILTKLDDASHILNYIECPIKAEGLLQLNRNKRYEFNGIELSSGCGIEFLANDDLHCQYDESTGEYTNIPYWCSSRIEHNGQDYYIVGYPDVKLDGLRVRIRRN